MAITKSDWKGIALVLSVFCVVLLVSTPEKALASSLAFGVFLAIVESKRESWSHRRFWVIIAVLAIVHIVVVYVIHIPRLRAGAVAAPFAFVDAFAIWGLVNWIERRFPYARAADPGQRHADGKDLPANG